MARWNSRAGGKNIVGWAMLKCNGGSSSESRRDEHDLDQWTGMPRYSQGAIACIGVAQELTVCDFLHGRPLASYPKYFVYYNKHTLFNIYMCGTLL